MTNLSLMLATIWSVAMKEKRTKGIQQVEN
jgi:hypothetical protein